MSAQHTPPLHTNTAPIGVFDSGTGGLSNLRALMQIMPHQHFIYVADMAYAPYGEHTDTYIVDRTRKIAHWLHQTAKAQGMVIACNTATAAAAKILREELGTSWPIIGVEPALKPAAQLTQTGRIGIMATASTLNSNKFKTLMRRIHENKQIALELFLCPCEGLAKAIDERNDHETDRLIELYSKQLLTSRPDVVVLGCTHYPLVKTRFERVMPGVHILDSSEAVAHRTLYIFNERNDKTLPPVTPSALAMHQSTPLLTAWTTADRQQLQDAIAHWLPEHGQKIQVEHLTV